MNQTGKFKKISLIVVSMLSPAIILSLLSLICKKNLFLAVPTWSDELDYFREVFSFSENGFKFGGSLFVGYAAKVGPLGAHSFSPLVVWGIPAILMGFGAHSILALNLIYLGIAWALLFLVLKEKLNDACLFLVPAFLYAPAIMYIFTSMIEIPLYALLIIYYAFFYAYGKDKKAGYLAGMYIAGVLCIGVRITYIVILFPGIMALSDYRVNKKTIRNLCIYVFFFLAFYKFYNIFCADYPDWVTSRISETVGITGKLKVIIYNTLSNLKAYFSISGERSQIVLRYAYGFMIVFLFILSIIKTEKEEKRFPVDGFFFSLFVMTGGLWAIMILLYDIKDWRDFRTFAPILFLDMLFLLGNGIRDKRKKAAKIFVVAITLLLFFVSNISLLTEDRAISKDIVEITELANLESKDSSCPVLAASMDVNWGDQRVQQSVPSNFGYQVFYNDIITPENLALVDYFFTTEAFLENRTELIQNLEFVAPITGYGDLYKVKK